MALVEINREPSARELRWFGLLFLLFFGIVGGIFIWRFSTTTVATVLWVTAAVVTSFYYLIPSFRKPLYLGWMYAVYPIGVTISFVIVASTYYLVITPIGLTLRLFGLRFLETKIDRDADTYWSDHKSLQDTRRYFQQF